MMNCTLVLRLILQLKLVNSVLLRVAVRVVGPNEFPLMVGIHGVNHSG